MKNQHLIPIFALIAFLSGPSSHALADSADRDACLRVIQVADPDPSGYVDEPLVRCTEVLDGNIGGKADWTLLSQDFCLVERSEGEIKRYAFFLADAKKSPNVGARAEGAMFGKRRIKRDQENGELVIRETVKIPRGLMDIGTAIDECLDLRYDRRTQELTFKYYKGAGLFCGIGDELKQHYRMQCRAISN